MAASQRSNSPPWSLIEPSLLPECRELRLGNTDMVGSVADTIGPEPAQLSARLEEAINHLSLGIVVFNEKREVVFCNRRYAQMYGLSPEQVRPGTPTSELIRHRLNLGLKVSLAPDEYVRARVGQDVALATTIQQFTDGRIIAYTVYPMPGGGGWRPTRTSPNAKN